MEKARFQLLLYFNENQDDPLIYKLDDSFIIGRNKSCKIRIELDTVSSEHCTLFLMPKSKYELNHYYVIRDGTFEGKHSQNGTWINNHLMKVPTRLNDLDEISFGTQYPKAKFRSSEESDESDINKGTGAIDRSSKESCEQINEPS